MVDSVGDSVGVGVSYREWGIERTIHILLSMSIHELLDSFHTKDTNPLIPYIYQDTRGNYSSVHYMQRGISGRFRNPTRGRVAPDEPVVVRSEGYATCRTVRAVERRC